MLETVVDCRFGSILPGPARQQPGATIGMAVFGDLLAVVDGCDIAGVTLVDPREWRLLDRSEDIY